MIELFLRAGSMLVHRTVCMQLSSASPMALVFVLGSCVAYQMFGIRVAIKDNSFQALIIDGCWRISK